MKRNQVSRDEMAPSFRTAAEIEECVVLVRLSEYNQGKPCGAVVIRRQLTEYGVRPLPSKKSINKILVTRSLTNGRTGLYQADLVPWEGHMVK
jgi:hypothetical protein